MAVLVLCACGNDSEDELLGNWAWAGEFGGSGRAYAAYFTIDNKAYVCCGFNGSKTRMRDVWEGDASSGKLAAWKRVAPFPGTARQMAVGFSINKKGYVGTGWDGSDEVMNDLWEFNPAGSTPNVDDPSNPWTGEWKQVASMPYQAGVRHSAVAFTLKVGGTKEYGYVGMGYTGGTEKLALLDLWRFDPTDGPTGKWDLVEKEEEKEGYGGSKRDGASVFVIGNKAYLCCGRNSGQTNVMDFWVFDPENGGVWAEKRKMWDANQEEDYDDDYRDLPRYGAVAFTMEVEGKPKGYIALGGKSSVWEYDPGSDLWTQRTNFTGNGRVGAVAFSFPSLGKVFVGLGNASVAYYDDFHQFFPTEENTTYDDY